VVENRPSVDQPLIPATTPEAPIHSGDTAQNLHARLGGRMTRRDILRRAVALGLAAPVIATLLAACGGDDDDDDGAEPTTGGGGNATAAPTEGGETGATATSEGGETEATAPSSGSGSGSGSGTASDKTLVIANNNEEIFTLDPSEYYEIRATPAMFTMYQPLIYQDYSSGEPKLTSYEPILAEEVPSLENGGISEDGITYVVKLRQGVKFHTGNEMTADDWVFALKRLWYLKKNPSFLAEPFASEDQVNVEATDPYTLTFTLLQPNAAFLAYLAGLSYIAFDSKAAAENGALDTPEAESGDTAGPSFLEQSLGTGPYKLTSFKSKEEIVFERFDDYWGDAPYFKQVVMKDILDSATRLQQLEAGDIDIAQELGTDALASIDGKEGFQIVKGNSLAHTYIAMHNDPAVGDIFSDVRVRQAVAQSIDFDGFAESLLGGAAVRPATAVPLGLQGADKVEDKKWMENVEAAKALIAEAGADGKTVTLSYGSTDVYDAVAAEVIAAKLQTDIERCGLKVELNPMETQQRLQDYRDAKLQFTISAWSPDYVDVHTYALPFGGVQDVSPSKRIAYINEENTALLEEAIAELDPAAREELYVTIQENMVEDAAFVVLWQPVYQVGMRADLTGYRVDPVAQTQSWTIAEG
jgi:peptide/nickel transport system substrate-binding protein